MEDLTKHNTGNTDSQDIIRSQAETSARNFGAAMDNLRNFRAMKDIPEAYAQDISGTSRVMKIISRAMGLPEPASLDDMSVRDITLQQGWWKSDGLVMVGTFDDGRDVALIPSMEGYRMWDERDISGVRVTEETAKKISQDAKGVYRPFPGTSMSLRGLAAWAAHMTREWVYVLFVGVISGAVGLLIPEMNGAVFGTLIPEIQSGQLMLFFALYALMAVVSGLLTGAQQMSLLRLESHIGHDIEAALWERVVNLPTSFFRHTSSGELSAAVSGFSTFWQGACPHLNTIIISVVMGLFYTAQILWYDWQMALVAICCLGAFMFFYAALGVVLVRYQRRVLDMANKLNGVVVNFVTGLAKIRVAAAEERVFSIWAAKFSRQQSFSYSQQKARGYMNAISRILSPVIAIAVFYWLSFEVMMDEEGVMQPYAVGSFMKFWSAYVLLQSSIVNIVPAVIGIWSSMPYLEKIAPILAAAPENSSGNRTDPGGLRGNMEMRDVSFRYSSSMPLLFSGLNLSVKEGEFLAVVGPSGSGKSTLLRILLGFETPEEGAVFYDNKPMANMDVKKLRRQIGVVLQNGGLISGDIYSNIACSRDTTDEAVWEAAEFAGIKEDIEAMPMGMYTGIMEGCGTISGGQRQRIIIARAFLGRPPIMFFDEPTSALDNRTQAIVMDSLMRMECTRVVIAHRLSTIERADRIIVVNGGSIIEEGTYESLMARGGFFHDLSTRQLV